MLDAAIDLPKLVDAALVAAREAGALVERGWRSHPLADHKRARVDLVTSYDRESETLLRARLTESTPFPVVGEEEGGQRALGAKTATWYVDPLDGTTNFVHGHPFWCVSIGLLGSDGPILGVVVAPSLRIEWTGIVGAVGGSGTAGSAAAAGKATRNGQSCRVSEVPQLDDALLATGFPYDRRSNPDNNFNAFVAIKTKCQAIRRCGSAAIDLCLVADGTYDGYWEKRLGPWDVAAGSAIVLAAGGRVSDHTGAPADLTRGNVVATNSRIHDELVGELLAVS